MPSYKSSSSAPRPDYVEAGEYIVEVVNAVETVSQNGNDMIELKLRVEPSGAIFYDNLVFVQAAHWKIDAFRAAIGESVIPGEVIVINAEDYIGKRARARLVVSEFGGRKRNKIGAWLVSAAPASVQAQEKGGEDDDNIPF